MGLAARRATPRRGHTAGHRGHHRPARPGLRQLRRHGHRRARAARPLRRRRRWTTTPSSSPATAASGGHQPRGGLARRPPRPRPADRASTTTTTSRSTATPSSRRQRRRRRRASSLRLARRWTSARSPTTSTRSRPPSGGPWRSRTGRRCSCCAATSATRRPTTPTTTRPTATRSTPRRSRRTKAVMGIPDEPFWAPAELVDAYRAHAAARGRRGPRRRGRSASPTGPATGTRGTRLGRHRRARLGGPTCPTFELGREARHPPGDPEGAQRHARLRARPGGGRGRPHRQHRHQARRRRAPVGRAPRRPPDPLRHPRARHGRGHVGMACHGGIAAGRRHVLRLQRLHAARRCASPRSSQAKVVFVFTHDSVGRRRGRPDPPAGRAPRRAAGHPRPAGHPPADANETVAAWRVAVGHDGPTALVLSRQASRSCTDGSAVEPRRRASSATPTARRRLVLVGTGSEVARVRRRGRRAWPPTGIAAAVVSHAVVGPLRATSPTAYRTTCCRPACPCSRSRPPPPSAGSAGPTTSIGIDRFGASAPGDVVLDKLGINVDHVVARATRPGRRRRTGGACMDRLDPACTTSRARAPGSTTSSAATSPSGQLAALRRRRHPRPHLEPDDLPEGDPGLGRLRRAVPRPGRRRAAPIVDDYWALVLHDIHGALDVFAPVYEPLGRRRRLRQRRGRPRPRPRHATGTDRRRPPPARARSTART